MDEKERGREALSPPAQRERVGRKRSGLHSGYPTFSLLPAQGPTYSRSRRFAPAPSSDPHPGRRAGQRRPPPGPAERGTRRVRPRSPELRERVSETAPRGGAGAHGAWPGRGQSAREAAAGPRLVGPAGSNLPGLSRCFEPLHPLAALRLLQPPGPRTRPGCASDWREAKTQVPPVAHPRAMCARSVGSPAGFPTDGILTA